LRGAGLRVDFVPPAQADEAAAGDVFEVVEVGGEEEDGDDEDEDAAGVLEWDGEGGGGTDKLEVKRRPKR
jgi:hypothetical protein